MEPIRFFVPGNPKGLKRHRTFRMKSGVNIQVDPSKGDKGDFLAKAMAYRPSMPVDGPLILSVICVFARPKCHFYTGKRADVLREDAPKWYASTPDWDNVGKFVGDALNGIFWKDDRLIVCGTVPCVYGPVPGVAVEAHSPTDEDYLAVCSVFRKITGGVLI